MILLQKVLFIFFFIIVYNSMIYGQVSDFLIPDTDNIEKPKSFTDEASVEIDKIPLNYHFFSFPFSTSFEPNKGDPITIKNTDLHEAYKQNYASFGYGRFKSPSLKIYTTSHIAPNNTLDVHLSHRSSIENSIPNTPLDNDFYNSRISIKNNYSHEKYKLQSYLRLSHQVFNWYGLPTEQANFTTDEVSSINEKQYLIKNTLGVILTPKSKKIKQLDFKFNMLFDKIGNQEANLVTKLKSNLKIDDQDIIIDTKVDYLYSQIGSSSTLSSFNNLLISTSPYIVATKENLYIKAGIIFFFNNQNNSKVDLFNISPILYASYKFLEDYIISYGGVSGKQVQNTYSKFTDKNIFVSPQLQLLPTKENLKIFFGTKGKLSSNISYDFSVSAIFDSQRPFFKLTSVNKVGDGFSYGNSFTVVYDQMNSFNGLININWNVDKKINLNWSLFLANYKTEIEKQAWNLPSFKSSLSGDYKISDRAYINYNLFFVGSRYDFFSDIRTGSLVSKTLKLEPFFDINAEFEYLLIKKYGISGFINMSNVLGNNYQDMANYRVQGRQAVLGISCKF